MTVKNQYNTVLSDLDPDDMEFEWDGESSRQILANIN